jgi:cell division protein FtsL
MRVRGTKPATAFVLKRQSVKARRDLKDMSFLYLSIFAAVLIAAVISGYLAGRLTYVNTGYEISSINRERSVLEERNKRLRVEIEGLRSPERIERIASRELGLGYPTSNQVVRIR